MSCGALLDLSRVSRVLLETCAICAATPRPEDRGAQPKRPKRKRARPTRNGKTGNKPGARPANGMQRQQRQALHRAVHAHSTFHQHHTCAGISKVLYSTRGLARGVRGTPPTRAHMHLTHRNTAWLDGCQICKTVRKAMQVIALLGRFQRRTIFRSFNNHQKRVCVRKSPAAALPLRGGRRRTRADRTP